MSKRNFRKSKKVSKKKDKVERGCTKQDTKNTTKELVLHIFLSPLQRNYFFICFGLFRYI
jgi:hypothetical protein